MVRKGLLLSLFIGAFLLSANAQLVEVKGAFLKDTIKIGMDIPYSLSVRYPKNMEVIFPDSTFKFNPFEYYHRSYYKTETDSVNSFDSVVYYLTTFEIDSVQYLQLPVFVKQTDDSASVFASLDSVILFHVIEQVPDSIALKENTAFIKVPAKFNYPIYLILSGLILFLVLVSLILFGKRIHRYIKLFTMKRAHRKFVEKFYHKLRGLRDNQIDLEPEVVLTDWKKYMEGLEKEPYTKLTSGELIKLHADQRLKENLKSIDRFIYGGIKDRPLDENFERLLEYSVERYELRLEEVNHG